MGPVKDVQTANDDNTMAARPSGDVALRCDPPLVTADSAGDAAASHADADGNYADNALQVEEPGYGYGV